MEEIKKIINKKRLEIEERNSKEMIKQIKFYDQKIIGNNLLNFGKEIEKYQAEILSIENKSIYWISWEYYKNLIFDPKNMKWRILPICACLPSNKIENMVWITNSEKIIPQIYKYVRSLKGVRSAVISRMGKNVKLHVHQGWECISNYILRCHLPIIVESNKSGLIVGDKLQYHDPKKYILFDDSIEHTGFNNSEKDRYILIIDFERPIKANKGISRIQISKGIYLNDITKKFELINKYYGNLK
jgi:hypothetical protein